MINCLVESASVAFSTIKPKGRKSKKPVDVAFERMVHDRIVDSMSTNTVICYSDGSASPNPGLCGAGVSIFVRDPDIVFDYGASLGRGTNNIAELYGLGIIFCELLHIRESNTQLTNTQYKRTMVHQAANTTVTTCILLESKRTVQEAHPELEKPHQYWSTTCQ